MIDSIVGAEYADADAVVIGVPYEQSASFGAGAKRGPLAVIDVLDSHLEFFDRYTKKSPAYDNKFGKVILDHLTEYSPEVMVNELSDYLMDEHRFYVLLGGVHSVSIASFISLAKKFATNEITIVQIDAHFDMRDDDSDYSDYNPSKFAHSTVMRRAHELGFNILPVGIRTMSKDEYEYIQKHNIQYYEWGRLDIPKPTIEEIVSSIPTEKVYLTIDVDGFDPSVMPGTGTPVPGGLSWEFGEALVREIMKRKTVIAGDIMEISPIDQNVLTEYGAAQLAYHMLALSKNT